MNKTLIVFSVVSIIITLMALSINQDRSYAHGGHKKNLSEDSKGVVRYSSHIKPIFQNKCAKCHGKNSPEHMEFSKNVKTFTEKMKGPRMDLYSCLTSFVIWPDTGSLMRAIDDGTNTPDKKPGRMYKHLGRTEEERQKNLQLFKAWVGFWTLKEWTMLSKNELNKIKIAY